MTGALLSVLNLEIRQILAGKKFLAAALLLLGASVLAFTVRRFAPDPEPGWPVIYLFMANFLFLHTLVILVPLLFMTSLIREETDEGTMVYLVTRPVPKPLLLLAKFAAAVLASAVLVLGGFLLFHAAFTLPGRPGDLPFDWAGRLGAFLQAGALGVVGYGALFTLAGVVSKRALVFGIAYGFLSEFLLSLVPAVVQKATLVFYLRSIALGNVGTMGDRELDMTLALLDLASPAASAAVVLGTAAVLLALSTFLVHWLEFYESRGAEAT